MSIALLVSGAALAAATLGISHVFHRPETGVSPPLVAPGPVPQEGVITIRADSWPPFNGEAGSSRPGYMVEVATAVFEKAGYRVDYQTMPWSRAIERTRAGEFDAVVGAFRTDVPDFIFPRVAMGMAETIVLVRKGTTWRYDGIDSLAKVKVGVVKDYSYGKTMDDYVRAHAADPGRIEIIYGEDVAVRNLRKLAMGRIDAMVDVRTVLDYAIAREGLAGRFIEAGTISRDDVHVAFSPRRPTSRTYAELLSKGIEELRESGQMQRILAAYGVRDGT